MALTIAIAAAALIGGAIAAWHYHRLGLTLTHYDARGHLVVARRILDSITPGWQQIGAVWLPLPHLLNALPVQIDFLYQTGASAVAISVASYAIATGAIAWIVFALTESAAASIAAAAVFALNPNVIYLQSTPLTEPLLIATTTVAVVMLMAWCEHGPTRGSAPTYRGAVRSDPRVRTVGADPCVRTVGADPCVRTVGADSCVRPATVGVAFALACLTRYEAWPLTVTALVIA